MNQEAITPRWILVPACSVLQFWDLLHQFIEDKAYDYGFPPWRLHLSLPLSSPSGARERVLSLLDVTTRKPSRLCSIRVTAAEGNITMDLHTAQPRVEVILEGQGLKQENQELVDELWQGFLQRMRESGIQTVIKILFLAANPADRVQLKLDAEMRDIDLALQQTAFRDRFDITGHGAVRAADLQGYLLRHKPDIVHFSGHGDPSSEIVLEDSSGKSHPVSVRALSQLFSVLKDDIRCVVLNACYSEQQAKAIAEHIDCVIGMSKTITGNV